MRPLEEARATVLAAMRPLPVASPDLADAEGLALVEDVVAAHDIPPFPNSSMDGYAVRASDVAEVPARLDVVADLRAGYVAGAEVRPGTAIAIMTGAPIPVGADAIVPVEQTRTADGVVTIGASVPTGAYVRHAGGDVAEGALVMRAGDRLGPAHLGVLASLGITNPPVRKRPVVALMSTGDEVVPPSTVDLGPGKIRDANRPVVTAMLNELGAEVVDLGIVKDDLGALKDALGVAANRADAVITSGGVSMGTHDLVKQVLAEAGTVEFWQVAMKPAKPFAFGHLDGTPLFGLPGNPVSAMVAFEQFVRPALLTMMGSTNVLRPRVDGFADGSLSTDPAKTVFLRAKAEYRSGVWIARLSDRQESNMLSAMAEGDCFVVVPRGTADLPDGGAVQLEMFRWPEDRPA
jgi:molybdopterin molybdotransferase